MEEDKTDIHWLGSAVKDDLKDIWHKFKEEDKKMLDGILKDLPQIPKLALEKGPEWLKNMEQHLAAQFANLSAPVIEDARKATMRRVGTFLGEVSKGFLKGLV